MLLAASKSSVNLGLEFRRAAANGNLEKLSQIYQAKPGVLNQAGLSSGKTALHQAVLHCKPDAVAWLLNQKADYLIEDASNQSALALAFVSGNYLLFACFYNYLHPDKGLLYQQNDLFEERVEPYPNTPILIDADSNQNVFQKLADAPGFAFTHYQAFAVLGGGNCNGIFSEFKNVFSQDSLQLYDLDFEPEKLGLSVSNEISSSLEYRQFQTHHAAVQIARLSEQYQGGIVVLVYGGIEPVLKELNQLYPQVENLFTTYPLALKEEQHCLELENKFSQLQIKSTPDILEEIRENAKASLNGTRNLQIKFFGDFKEVLVQQIKLVSTQPPSKKKSSPLFDLLSIYEGGELDLDRALSIARNYSRCLTDPSATKELENLRAGVQITFRYFVNQIAVGSDVGKFLYPALLFLLVQSERFDSVLKKIQNHQRDLILFGRATMSVANYLKESKAYNLEKEIVVELLKRSDLYLSFSKNSRLSYPELQHLIDVKNQRLKATHFPCNIEVINVWYCETVNNFRASTCQVLFEKAMRMERGQLRRTRFVIYPNSMHALFMEMSWNKHKRQIEIVIIDSTNLPDMYGLLLELTAKFLKANTRYQVLACSASVQKDDVSCLLFSLMMCTQISHYSFERLGESSTLDNVEFECIDSILSAKDIVGVKWIVPEAFGEKMALMCQSSNDMKRFLLALHNNDQNKVSQIISQWQDWYGLTDDSQCTDKINYFRYRYVSLTQNHLLKTCTMAEILKTTKADDLGVALRRLATGAGPKWMLATLLSQVNQQVVNEASDSTGRTALHWSYRKGRLGRAALLLENGANPNLTDKKGYTPIQNASLS